MNKFLMPALIIVIIVQLLVPASMIANKYDILKNGEEFKFQTRPVDPYDAFRGRYVWLGVENSIYYGDGVKYGVINVDEDGFAKIVGTSDTRPADMPYVKSMDKNRFVLPIERYYMDEELAPEAERVTGWGSELETYVTVRIKNGNTVISGLYVDGIEIEKYITEDR